MSGRRKMADKGNKEDRIEGKKRNRKKRKKGNKEEK